MTPLLYDAHNHLQDEFLRPHLPRVLGELAGVGIAGAIVNGTEEDDWDDVTRLAAEHSWVVPSYGLHPWFISTRTEDWQQRLVEKLDAAPGPVAIGEIGLDRWLAEFDFADQCEVFSWQLRLAAQRNLPASIHCLQAWGALHQALRTEPLPDRGFLIHAYGGPEELVGPFAKLGAFFSFNGSFLQPRKEARRRIFRRVPIERLLVETDAPAMPPPHDLVEFPLPDSEDGKRINHPANIAATYRALADIRGMAVEELAAQVEGNFRRLFL